MLIGEDSVHVLRLFCEWKLRVLVDVLIDGSKLMLWLLNNVVSTLQVENQNFPKVSEVGYFSTLYLDDWV